VAVGVVAAAAVIGAGAAVLARSDDAGVPLERPLLLNILGTFKPGQDTFSMAFMPLQEKGKDIEILKVQARTSPNVEHFDTVAIWPRDVEKYGNPGNLFGFPVRPDYHPAFGTVVSAEELNYTPKGFGSPAHLFVNAGFRLLSGDVGAVNGIKVTYRVGSKTKTQFFPHAVIVCKAPNKCGTPERGVTYGQDILTQFGLVPKGTY
jgi:hypothetical protein